jgi:hypothetical protein
MGRVHTKGFDREFFLKMNEIFWNFGLRGLRVDDTLKIDEKKLEILY